MKLSPNEEDRLWREQEKVPWFQFPSPLRYVIFLICLIALLVGLWYLIAPSRQWYSKSDLPLIRADQAPYKIKPASQEVPNVKHQDKLVYGRIRGDQTEPVVEHILPDPEAPQPALKDGNGPIKMVEEYAPEEVDPDKIGEAKSQEPEKKEANLTSIEDLIEEDPTIKPKAEQQAPKGKTLIQLGSLKTYDTAESEWERLAKKHQDVLQGLSPVIQKVDLGAEQGIYYRLRTGPFESLEKAKAACTILKEQKVECRVVP